MKKNTLTKIVAGTILGTLFNDAIAQPHIYRQVDQNRAPVSQNFQNFSNSPSDWKEALAANYFRLDESLIETNSLWRNAEDRTALENFFGLQEGVRNGSSAGLAMVPENGRGSIKIMEGLNGYSMLGAEVVQIGSGYGKRPVGKFNSEIAVSRDLSYTWAIYANSAGYDNSTPERSDEMLKHVISYKTGIPTGQLIVARDANGTRADNGSVVDILYMGTEKYPDVAPRHAKPGEVISSTQIDTLRKAVYSDKHCGSKRVVLSPAIVLQKKKYINTAQIVNHVNMTPGESFVLPVRDLLYIAGVDADLYFNSFYNQEIQKPASGASGRADTLRVIIEKEKECEEYKETPCEDDPNCDQVFDFDCPTCPRPQRDVDSIEYRMGVKGTGSSKGTHGKTAGIAVYSQLGKCAPWNRLDLEVAFSMLKETGNFERLTKEDLKHHTLPLKGVSELLEKGNYTINDLQFDLILARHAKHNALSVRAGVSAEFPSMKYNGTETRTTWYDDDGKKIEWDQTKRDVALNTGTYNNYRIKPIVGLGINLGRAVFSVDYHIPIQRVFEHQYTGPIDMGAVKFGFGLEFGPSKSDHKYSDNAVNLAHQKTINAENAYYQNELRKMKAQKALQNRSYQKHYHK